MDIPLPPAVPPLTRAELTSRIDAALPDNLEQAISPEDIRSRLHELVDSSAMLAEGEANIPGQDVPAGGSTGQLFTKLTAADYDSGWQHPTATHGGGVARPLADRFAEAGYPVREAGTWDSGASAATNTATLQAAINTVSGRGGGIVQLPYGSVTCNQIVLKDKVVLRGVGAIATQLVAAAGLNSDFIVSDGFAALTGTGGTAGVPKWLGLQELRVHGNRANQSGTSRGVCLYARAILNHDLIITDCLSQGLWTEYAAAVGVSSYADAPEGNSGYVLIIKCGSGWVNRGPHDHIVDRLVIALCDGDGLRIETGANYIGTCDIKFAHIYFNGGIGLYASTGFRGGTIISETSGAEGFVLDGAIRANIAQLQLFANGRTSNVYQAVIDTDSHQNQIGNLQIVQPYTAGVGGLQLAGDFNVIANLEVDGQIYASAAGATAVALDIDGALGNVVNGNLKNHFGTGGIGLRLGATAAASNNHAKLHIYNCAKLFSNVNAGFNNILELNGFAGAGAEGVATGSVVQGPSNRWDISFNLNGTHYYADSGTYTPTLTSVANLDANTPSIVIWSRKADKVTISGQFQADATTSNTTAQLGISLPTSQPSNFTSAVDASGVMSGPGAAGGFGAAGYVTADATNDRLNLSWIPNPTTNQTYQFIAQYTVK